jgi:hypothetical protein
VGAQLFGRSGPTMDDFGSRLRHAHRRIGPPEPAFDRLVDRRKRKRRTSRIASLAMALVVTAGGIAGAVVALGHTGSARHVGPGLADGGSTGPNLVAGPGQYYYSRTQIYFAGSSPPPSEVVGPWTLSIWFAPDGSGRSLFSDPTNMPDEPSQTFGWRGGPDETYGPGRFPLQYLSNLSTNPDDLRAQLSARTSAGGASPNPIPTSSPGRSETDTSMLRTLQDLFNADEQFTTPAVRAAMVDVASGVDGVETLRGVTDPVGRPATGLRWEIFYQDTPSYVEWYFDPSSKQLMAETWMQDGKVLEARVVSEAGIADSTDAPPTSSNDFFPAAQREPSFGG